MCTKCAHGKPWDYNEIIEMKSERKETTNSETVATVVNPQTLDQSNKELSKFPRS